MVVETNPPRRRPGTANNYKRQRDRDNPPPLFATRRRSRKKILKKGPPKSPPNAQTSLRLVIDIHSSRPPSLSQFNAKSNSHSQFEQASSSRFNILEFPSSTTTNSSIMTPVNKGHCGAAVLPEASSNRVIQPPARLAVNNYPAVTNIATESQGTDILPNKLR
mmetsp:Transcript_15681/g.17575  ORF Transcript_15681/g.17575 Transcript_15681/m.17575 type:complete len:163 (-) Transcript_15681:110-598(-)